MIVYKGCIIKAHVEVSPISILPILYGQVKISLDFSGNTELNFYVNKRQEKRLNNLLEKAMNGMTRIIIKLEEEKNATKS